MPDTGDDNFLWTKRGMSVTHVWSDAAWHLLTGVTRPRSQAQCFASAWWNVWGINQSGWSTTDTIMAWSSSSVICPALQLASWWWEPDQVLAASSQLPGKTGTDVRWWILGPHLRLVGDNLWSFEIMAPTRDPGRDQRTPADILFIYPPVPGLCGGGDVIRLFHTWYLDLKCD